MAQATWTEAQTDGGDRPRGPARAKRERNLMVLAWTGPVGIFLVFLGLALAGFLPPPTPNMTEAQKIALWTTNPSLKQAGMILAVWGGTLYVTFTVAITIAMRRIPGDRGVLSTAQAALGTFGTVFFSANFLILAIIPFRDPPLIGLHDLGFIWTFSPAAPFVFQYFTIGLASLQDRSDNPVFASWIGYINFWVGVGLIPASLIPFFHTGPLAWNGLLGFYIPATVFVIWYVVMFAGLRKFALRMAVDGHGSS